MSEDFFIYSIEDSDIIFDKLWLYMSNGEMHLLEMPRSPFKVMIHLLLQNISCFDFLKKKQTCIIFTKFIETPNE
jgi:hypothetical protein